ncbi:uncharacterized protein RJT21DRAFT_41840 [Scheffersomyces amazonensis]|uniref:uncharacterized protein n=1 Tax=Scheffersomyces amazonensis TaxID=1078765 RepID=UPI00315CB4AB
MTLLLRIRPLVKIRRHPYIQLPLIRHTSTKFFLENDSIDHNTYPNTQYVQPQDEQQIILKNIMTSRKPVLNPRGLYDRITDRTSRKFNTLNYEDFNRETIGSFDEICRINNNTCPTIGSIVEYIDEPNNTVSIGIVLREAQSKFNENYNKLVVLSVDNIIESVAPSSVTFHLNQVLKSDYVESFKILENRFDALYKGRSEIISILKEFISSSLQMSQELNPQLEIFYAQYSSQYTINSISLIDFIESLRLSESLIVKIHQSYFHQCVLLMSLHILMVNSPNFMVPSFNVFNRQSNIIHQFSNQLPKGSDYFVNSEYNCLVIDKFLNNCSNPEEFVKCNSFLTKLLKDQVGDKAKSLDDINLYFNIWEGRHYKYIIDVLKFLIIHPQPSLMTMVEGFDVFKNQLPLSPAKIYQFLHDLHVYDNGTKSIETATATATNPLLSANVLGKHNHNALSITSMRQLMSSSSIPTTNLSDYFTHLRNQKSYYTDHIIYGLPIKLNNGGSTILKESVLAISIEKINSRKYSINIHIPDIVTKISPNSNIIKHITSNSSNMKSLKNNLSSIFGSLDWNGLKFNNQNIDHTVSGDEYSYSNASDIFTRSTRAMDRLNNINKVPTTCLTISFEYNTFHSNPFSNLEEKISFSFDSLALNCIKNIPANDLEDCLSGKADSSSPFRLFTRPFRQSSNPEKPKLLSKEDIHNVCFIFNIMKRHFKFRNHEGASSIVTGGGNEEFPKSEFFINEIEKFVGNLTATYCQYHQVPIITHQQSIILDQDNQVLNSKLGGGEDDNALVSHNNTFLPSFLADTYYQTLISRDELGHVSLSANIIGSNYLSRSQFVVNSGKNSRNVPLGMKNGYVKLCNVFEDFEVFINQLQILNYIQSHASTAFMNKSSDRLNHIEFINKFSYLKGLGYNLNGTMEPSVLNIQIKKLSLAQTWSNYINHHLNSFATLKRLEYGLLHTNELSETTPTYECVITYPGYRINDINARLVRGFCKELGLEVEIVISETSNSSIGSLVMCDKVMYLDPVGGQCILRQVETF